MVMTAKEREIMYLKRSIEKLGNQMIFINYDARKRRDKTLEVLKTQLEALDGDPSTED